MTVSCERNESCVCFHDVNRIFVDDRRGSVAALTDITLRCEPGRLTCVLGPSGCGKTTLLRLAAGLDSPTTGGVTIAGRPTCPPRPEMRLAMVSQEGDLLPWMNIQDNVALGLEIRGVGRKHRLARARRTLRRLRLPDDVDRALPHQLSGGMRQRVALARALCSQPEVLLMDEPFASLDEPTRYHLQDLLVDVWRSSRRTILFVTHSLEEAVYLADRIVILAGGRIRGDMPLDLPRPRDRMAKDFIGRMLEVRELFARSALEGQAE